MNKTEIVNKVSERSGVDQEICMKVVDAFEQVLSDELSNSKSLGHAFDKMYKVLHFFKNR